MRLDKRIEKTATIAKNKKGIRFYSFHEHEYIFIRNPEIIKSKN